MSAKLIRRIRNRPALLYGGLTAMAGFGCLLFVGCGQNRGGVSAWRESCFYPPKPQTPRIVALGSMRSALGPTQRQVEFSMFLFGAEPPPTLVIGNPTGIAVGGTDVQVCDAAIDTVLEWRAATPDLGLARVPQGLDHPRTISFAPGGDRLICTRRGVARVAADGGLIRTYTLDSQPFLPASALAVGDEVWATNTKANRVEVFDAASGEYKRAFGRSGVKNGEFVFPRGMDLTPEGEICVVDMLNNRVQVFDATGNWTRQIGMPGDSTGQFGRPKDVAVGPDGTVFVTDTFSQRVHVFDAKGEPLLAFGEPGSGPGELALPSGIAIIETRPYTTRATPVGVVPIYYVLVTEQLNRPGVRIYAWLGGKPDSSEQALPSPEASNWTPAYPELAAINPHWNSDRCDSCHEQRDGRLAPIPAQAVDDLCISCHDGIKGPADPHPIGRPARGEHVTTPEDWPTVDGMVGCMTCHDVEGHCKRGARRPAVNTVLLRQYDPQHPLEYCTICHESDVGQRFSPHRQRDASGKVREDACLFCHTQAMKIPADGRRRFEPHLRDETSQLCLNCHSKHWDLSTKGHVDRPVTPKIRKWMLMRQLSYEFDESADELAKLASQPDRRPARLPLGDGKVTCYSCHNPHYAGMFAAGSELGALASEPQDRASALRENWIDLCSECHQR